MMTNLSKAIQREIALFKDAIEVSKSAFCKARKKLKHTAFIELSNVIKKEFYRSDEALTWHGYRVLAVDGSTHELPGSNEIEEHYGVFARRDDGKAIILARSLMIYDALNHITLYGQIDKVSQSENAMFWKYITEHRTSKKLLFYLNSIGVQFCFRMKKNWKETDRFCRSGKQSDIITIGLPFADREKAVQLGITAVRFKCRLVSIELEGGETEILLTSIKDEEKITTQDLKQLYALRWSVEESYKTFKQKVCIDNFSGKSVKSVLQDFFVKIFIMNLTAVAVRPINEALKKPAVKVKYTYQVNIIEAIATMKRGVVSFFITKTIGKALQRLYNRLQKNKEPIRPDRKYKRYILKKRKHYMNYKPT